MYANNSMGCRQQCGNAQAGTKYIVQSLLFDTAIFALAGYLHPQCVAIEATTSLRICHHNGNVVNSQKEPIFVLPLGVALSRWKP
jgi:hypothetical protein